MRGAVETVAVPRDVASSSPSKPAAALEMMRYQRPNPDCLPLPNGIGSGSGSSGSRKPPPPPAPATHRSSKDEVAPAVATDSSRLAAYIPSSSLEPKQRSRAPPPPPPAAPSSSSLARSPARDLGHHHHHHASDFSDPSSPSYLAAGGSGSAGAAGGGEVLLQWGQNKRTRGRRDASTGAASPLRRAKIPRRSPAADKLMPPPSGPSYTRSSNLRVGSLNPPARGADVHHGRSPLSHHRSAAAPAEERAGGKARPEKQQRPDKQRADASPVMGLKAPDQKQLQQAADHHHQAAASSSKPPKLEMPRIYTTLSRKEKEEDFLIMKGTKLPVRPKKRPKAVEKAVNFICPGMWLTDVTRNRYEVREKKCPKKQKHRGLKGMESMDSDSD